MSNLFKTYESLQFQKDHPIGDGTKEQLDNVLKKYEQAAKLILETLPYRSLDSEELKETPKRFAKMMLEQLQGEFMDDYEIANECIKLFPTQRTDMVVVKNIRCFSHCEHHIALMYNMSVDIGYFPDKYILGLSKFARIVDLVSKRLQTQEKMGEQLLQLLNLHLPNKGIVIQIKAEHSCMTARGIQKVGAQTITLHKTAFMSEGDLNHFYKALEEK